MKKGCPNKNHIFLLLFTIWLMVRSLKIHFLWSSRAQMWQTFILNKNFQIYIVKFLFGCSTIFPPKLKKRRKKNVFLLLAYENQQHLSHRTKFIVVFKILFMICEWWKACTHKHTRHLEWSKHQEQKKNTHTRLKEE